MSAGEAELLGFLNRKTVLFEKALWNLISAKYRQKGDPNAAMRDLTVLLRETLILSNLYGRRRTLLEADRAERAGTFALPDETPLSYGVVFEEALENLLTREPRLAQSAAEVSRMYSMEHVFAMAKSISEKLTSKVQKKISDAVVSGEAKDRTEKEILKDAADEAHAWSSAYAATVYETNVSTVYTEGRFAQAKDPEVAQVVKAFEVVGVDDVRERDNHSYARGLIAAVDAPVWSLRKAKPPYGYRCRHGVVFASKYTLERLGNPKPDGLGIYYAPPNFNRFAPDPGFNVGVY